MKKFLILALMTLPIISFTSCNSDDDGDVPSQASRTYLLNSVSDPGIFGSVRFVDNNDGTVTIELSLSGTTAGNMHPAHIHFNSAVEGGGVAVTLESVDGETGESSTTISQLDDSTPVTYTDLVTFDGHVNVHQDSNNLAILVGQADIGENELTGLSVVYPLNQVASSGISGNVTFFERLSGETLVAINVSGGTPGTNHAAHIHEGSVATSPGAIAISLNNVSGASGISLTNVSQLADMSPITYTQLLTYNGYLNVHNPADISIIDAQGDIGLNFLN